MVTYELYPPSLPQMNNDGYINEAELESANGVNVEINRYLNPAVGDYLCLYWDNEVAATLWLTDDNLDSAFPWQITIPQNLIPDGTHQVYFTATDTYQNIAASGISTAIVDRSHTGTLPPPVLTDAVNNTINYQSVMFNNGTHIAIPVPETNIVVGDTVNIYWEGFDGAGEPLPESMTSFTHVVTEDDLQGFSVLVAPPYISVINEGTAMCWYAVVDSAGQIQNSESATATIDMTYSGIYPAPVFPAGSDGWLDCAECTNGVDIFIPANALFVTGGVAAIYWQGYQRDGTLVANTQATISHILTDTDITNGFTVTVDEQYVTPIGIGFAQSSYQVMSPATPGYSPFTQVNVDTEHCALLPGPAFPDAEDDGVISGKEIAADEGTDMVVTYPGMTAGDTVTAFCFGYTQSPAEPVPGTSWTETRNLTLDEAAAQSMIFHIPATFINPVENGYLEGRYMVMFKNGGMATSETTDVKVKLTADNGLRLICGTGAPIFDPIIPVRPLNKATLSGPAGARVILSLPGGSQAYFNPGGEQTLTVSLDEQGKNTVEVYAFAAGNATINAYVISNPTLNASASMEFNEWTPGTGDILCYGISTGGLADATGTCGVYVQTTINSQATQARLVLTGTSSAFIPATGTQSAFVDISTTHACGFDVADSVAEKVSFTLSLPDVSQSYITNSLTFSDFE